MNLLVLTQKIDGNDPVLGFFGRWVEEFAKNVSRLTVICLEKGDFDLLANVKILSLVKDKFKIQNSKFKIPRRVLYVIRFYYLIWKLRREYDAVFVHMNPEYVILGGFVWKILGKRIALWYVHKAVNRRLWLAEKLADKIFTASPESFRLSSKKVEIVGHGIDIDKFKTQNSPPKEDPPLAEKLKTTTQNHKLTIITAGRIAPVKNVEVLIEAGEILKNRGIDFSAQGGPASGWEIKIAGGPATKEDENYFEKLKALVKEKELDNSVSFVGPVSYSEIQDFYAEGDIFVNFSETGSMDKAVLEAMASGLSVITSNEAFKNILPPKYFLDQKSPEKLTQKIIDLSKDVGPKQELREIVVKNHSLEGLIKRILKSIME